MKNLPYQFLYFQIYPPAVGLFPINTLEIPPSKIPVSAEASFKEL